MVGVWTRWAAGVFPCGVSKECVVNLAHAGGSKVVEKAVVKEKVLVVGEAGPKDVVDKRKRNRATANLLSVNSNPSSPSGAKRRRV